MSFKQHDKREVIGGKVNGFTFAEASYNLGDLLDGPGSSDTENNQLVTRLQGGALIYVTVGDDPIEPIRIPAAARESFTVRK